MEEFLAFLNNDIELKMSDDKPKDSASSASTAVDVPSNTCSVSGFDLTLYDLLEDVYFDDVSLTASGSPDTNSSTLSPSSMQHPDPSPETIDLCDPSMNLDMDLDIDQLDGIDQDWSIDKILPVLEEDPLSSADPLWDSDRSPSPAPAPAMTDKNNHAPWPLDAVQQDHGKYASSIPSSTKALETGSANAFRQNQQDFHNGSDVGGGRGARAGDSRGSIGMMVYQRCVSGSVAKATGNDMSCKNGVKRPGSKTMSAPSFWENCIQEEMTDMTNEYIGKRQQDFYDGAGGGGKRAGDDCFSISKKLKQRYDSGSVAKATGDAMGYTNGVKRPGSKTMLASSFLEYCIQEETTDMTNEYIGKRQQDFYDGNGGSGKRAGDDCFSISKKLKQRYDSGSVAKATGNAMGCTKGVKRPGSKTMLAPSFLEYCIQEETTDMTNEYIGKRQQDFYGGAGGDGKRAGDDCFSISKKLKQRYGSGAVAGAKDGAGCLINGGKRQGPNTTSAPSSLKWRIQEEMAKYGMADSVLKNLLASGCDLNAGLKKSIVNDGLQPRHRSGRLAPKSTAIGAPRMGNTSKGARRHINREGSKHRRKLGA